MSDLFDPEGGLLSLTPTPRAEINAPFSRDLLRAVGDLLLETTYDGVWLVDAEARTTFANERIAEMLGYSVEEMLGVPLFQFMDAEGARKTKDNLERRRLGVQEQHEFRCIHKNGTPVWLLVTANPVYDRMGGYAGSLALIADLSVQKERERALLAEKAELERRLEQLTAERASFEALAHRDALTGLHSRRYFDERIAQETDRCRRYCRRLSLLFIDIDGFKQINDRWGHSVGDEVLRGIGLALTGRVGAGRPLLRSSDVAARFGGDEIVVLALETDLDGGHALAGRVLDGLLTGPTVEGKSVPRSVSIGVASCPFHAAIPAELIAAADRAMYQAKAAGGGRACLAEMPGHS